MFEVVTINGKGVVALVWTSWVSFLAWLIGGFDTLVITLLIFMVLDYITGLICGFYNKKLNTKRAYKGLRKKMLIWIIIGCATLLSYIIKEVALRNVIIMFYVATEFLSIIENAAQMGVPIPEKLKQALEQCKNNQCEKK